MYFTENLNLIAQFFRNIWSVFALQHPLLGISFASIFIGLFVVKFSLNILSPILGIGGSIYKDNKKEKKYEERRKAFLDSRRGGKK